MSSNPIPQPSAGIPAVIQRVLAPMRDVLQRAFFLQSDERSVTRKDLVDLGLIQESDLTKLED